MRPLTFALLLPLATATQASAPQADPIKTLVRQMLQTSSYKRADAELNGDGRQESFVYVTDPKLCASGGCLLLILSPHGSRYRVVMRTSVTRLPITVLPTATLGWRDVGVSVQGGGIIRPYMARLRFNGRRYPSNPTMPPAAPLHRTSGRVLIGC